MSASKYEIFSKIAELGGLTRAAEHFGCTQSNISHVLQSFEKELGFPLLSRGRGGIRLTPEGEKLLPAVRAVVAAEQQLDRTAAELRERKTGVVRVGAFTSVAVHWLPGIIKLFSRSCPMAEIKLLNGDYHDVDQWLRDGSVDLAFVALPLDAECRVEPLVEDRLMAVLPQGHPLAAGESFPVEAVAGEDFISLLETSDHDARRVLAPAGVRANIKYTTKDDYAIIAMVESGLGISIMPELLLRGRSEQVAVLPLDPSAHRTIGLALPECGMGNSAAEKFAACVRVWLAGENEAGRTR